MAIILCVLSFACSAVGKWWTGDIYRVFPLASGEVVVSFEVSAPSCTGADTHKFHRIKVGENSMTQEGADKIYSLLLAAASSKRQVSINFDDATNKCYVNRAYINFSQ